MRNLYIREYKESYRQEFHKRGDDGRVLADDRFLEKGLGTIEPPSLKVSLDGIVNYVSKEYEISEEVLRGSSRNSVTSEARALIGWLGNQLGASSITKWQITFNGIRPHSVGTLEI